MISLFRSIVSTTALVNSTLTANYESHVFFFSKIAVSHRTEISCAVVCFQVFPSGKFLKICRVCTLFVLWDYVERNFF